MPADPALADLGDLPSFGVSTHTGSCGKAEAERGERGKEAIHVARVREGA